MSQNLVFKTILIILNIHAILGIAKPEKVTILQVIEKTINIHGKSSQVYSIQQPNGTMGFYGNKGEIFDAYVQNKTHVPLVLHWHGLIVPNNQDGVPYVTQRPIQPGEQYHYHFLMQQAGTFWMHSHYQFQIQKLMAAPFIIHDPQQKPQHEIVMLVQDFTFKDPKLIYENLRHQQLDDKHMNMHMDMSPDVNDVQYPVYLVNQKTLRDPERVFVKENEKVRLRIINASASSSFYIDLGQLSGKLVAIDGAEIKPLWGHRFQLGLANRLDIEIEIPRGTGNYPLFALPEGTHQQAGLILATQNAPIPIFQEQRTQMNPLLDFQQELKTEALHPFAAKAVQENFNYKLAGEMNGYHWTINDQEWPLVTPYIVKPKERTLFTFKNVSAMPHPMHFHGHVFQVVEINGKKINGRQGDSLYILPHSTVKVIFDTNNPGIWMLHCHVLYHQFGGMMTTFNYENYPQLFSNKERQEEMQLHLH